MRSFIGIKLPSDIKRKIDQFQIKHENIGFNWVAEENLHITLKFLAEVTKDQVLGLQRSLGLIKGGSFLLQVEKLDLFPSWAHPRVLICTLKGEVEKLMKLQKSIENVCRTLGLSSEKRPFHPHITLARIKKLGEVKKIRPYVGEKFLLDLPITEFSLVKSTLTPEGSQYETIKEFVLNE